MLSLGAWLDLYGSWLLVLLVSTVASRNAWRLANGGWPVTWGLRCACVVAYWVLVSYIAFSFGGIYGMMHVGAQVDASVAALVGTDYSLVEYLLYPFGFLLVPVELLLHPGSWLGIASVYVASRLSALLWRLGAGSRLGASDGAWTAAHNRLRRWVIRVAVPVVAATALGYVAPPVMWRVLGQPLTIAERERATTLPAQGFYLTNGTPLTARDGGATNMWLVGEVDVRVSDGGGNWREHTFRNVERKPQQRWAIKMGGGTRFEATCWRLTRQRAVERVLVKGTLAQGRPQPALLELQFIEPDPRVLIYGPEPSGKRGEGRRPIWRPGGRDSLAVTVKGAGK